MRLSGVEVDNEVGKEIYELEYLKKINVSYDFEIPITLDLTADISKLQNLEEFIASGSVSGDLPEEIFGLNKLKKLHIIPSALLDFDENDEAFIYGYSGGVSGSLSPSIGNLTNLEELVLVGIDRGRGLTGNIPSSIANLSNLKKLRLDRNQLSGEIPKELSALTQLESINLSQNKLTGPVPTELLNLPSLTTQDYKHNSLDVSSALTLGEPSDYGLAGYQQLSDAQVTRADLSNDSILLVEWSNVDWMRGEFIDLGTLLDEVDGEVNDVSRYGHHDLQYKYGYKLFVQTLAGNFQELAVVDDIETLRWEGEIDTHNLALPLNVQVRRTKLFDWGARLGVQYLESSGPLPRFVEPVDPVEPVNENIAPSFYDIGDVLHTEVGQALAIPGWASNLDDGNGGSQALRFELKAMSNPYQNDLDPATRTPISYPHISVPSGTLNFTPTAGAEGESLVVFQLCDDGSGVAGGGLCSDDSVFKIKVSGGETLRTDIPTFSMDTALDLDVDSGSGYAFKEHLNWARDILVDSQDPTAVGAFHTVWVTNSELFEIDPWISYPSGTLRYKFKNGVEGQSEVYFSLSNTAGKKVYSDHQKVVLSIGDNLEASDAASEEDSDDVISAKTGNAIDAVELEREGGGGGLGWALLGLGVYVLRTNRIGLKH